MSLPQRLHRRLAGDRRRERIRQLALQRRVRYYRGKVANQLGEALHPHQPVHHIDGNPTNDDLDNLMALCSQKAHMFLHQMQRHADTGLVSLYPLAQLFHLNGYHVIWANEAGITAVFGTEETGFILARTRQEVHDEASRGDPVRSKRQRKPPHGTRTRVQPSRQ